MRHILLFPAICGLGVSGCKTSPPEAQRLQLAVANSLGVDVKSEIDLGGGATMKLMLIPSGKFYMGGKLSVRVLEKRFGLDANLRHALSDEHPRHEVVLSKPYYMGMTEVTQGQWMW